MIKFQSGGGDDQKFSTFYFFTNIRTVESSEKEEDFLGVSCTF